MTKKEEFYECLEKYRENYGQYRAKAAGQKASELKTEAEINGEWELAFIYEMAIKGAQVKWFEVEETALHAAKRDTGYDPDQEDDNSTMAWKL